MRVVADPAFTVRARTKVRDASHRRPISRGRAHPPPSNGGLL